MKRPVVAIASLAFAIVAAALSAPFLLAAIRHPSSQDTPIWLALGTSAALSSAFAIGLVLGAHPSAPKPLLFAP
jgi:uncharacterized membrane protein